MAKPWNDRWGTRCRRDSPATRLVLALDLRTYLQEHLDLDVDGPIEASDWLALPEQRLRLVTAGAVSRDEVGLPVLRDRLALPAQRVAVPVDRRLVAGAPRSQSHGTSRIRRGRAGLGVIASQLVDDLMHLCFLMEKQYAPYSKWFGTTFSRLECAPSLAPVLQGVLGADTWSERRDALAVAYQHVAALHDTLGITPPVQIEVQAMWNRPLPLPGATSPDAEGSNQIQAVLRMADRTPLAE